MRKYIVRQPMKNANNNIVGYEIQYNGEHNGFGENYSEEEYAAATTIYNLLMSSNEKILRGSLNFMTFTTNLLLKNTPRLFAKEDLVIQIDDSVIIHPVALQIVKKYSDEGYKVAVNEFQFMPRYISIIDYIDYIKLDITKMSDESIEHIVKITGNMGKKCIVTNIDSKEKYDRAVSLGVDLLDGSYVASKLRTEAKNADFLKSNFFRLMVEVNKDEPDMDEIEKIISVDASLTYGILKLANSYYFSMRSRVNTIRQAIVTIGLNELKQWTYLLSVTNESGDLDSGAEDLLKLSFSRAIFAEALYKNAKKLSFSKQDAYLMGMFSTINYLIDAPIEVVLAQIPLSDEIRDALFAKDGEAGALYNLILSYEKADWSACEELSSSLGIKQEDIASIYFDSAEKVAAIWERITTPVEQKQ